MYGKAIAQLFFDTIKTEPSDLTLFYGLITRLAASVFTNFLTE